MAGETVRTHVVFPKELVGEVDRLVGRRKRSAFLTEAVMEKVRRERLGRALAATAGFLALEAHPEWATPEAVSSWVRQQRMVDDEATARKLEGRVQP
jgi:metal-responsive CopG/Arc/MetJ family transcriptional regulator